MKKLIFIISIILLQATFLNAFSLRLDVDALKNNLSKYKIIDTRDANSYSLGHIPNAINFPVSLTYEHQSINGKLTSPLKMQKIIQNLGLREKEKIVIYDDGSFFDAARLFWALEVYGFNHVKLLNSGYKQWIKRGLAVSTSHTPIQKSDYIAIVNNKRLATKFTTQIATKNPNQLIIDARNNKSYIGKASSAKRFGHIPKALNIPATHNINYNKELVELKGLSALQDLYKQLDKKKKIVIYCAIGKISATNYFALRELGYDVSNYDASWKEWGNDFKLPIITITK